MVRSGAVSVGAAHALIGTPCPALALLAVVRVALASSAASVKKRNDGRMVVDADRRVVQRCDANVDPHTGRVLLTRAKRG